MESEQQLKLSFLYKASFALFTQSSDLSRHLLSTMQQSAQEADIQIDPKIKRRYCSKCFNLFIPGLNTTVTKTRNRPKEAIDQTSHDKGHHPKLANYILFNCHSCQSKTYFSGISKEEQKKFKSQEQPKSHQQKKKTKTSQLLQKLASKKNTTNESKKALCLTDFLEKL
jgi:RNase P subunit RPR2